jgi:uncharacterized spore protein YtfJ
MDESFDQIAAAAAKSQEQATHLFERLMEVAEPESVYSEAVTSGEYTVITASEVTTGLGFGYGVGGGSGTFPASKEEGKEPDAEAKKEGQGSGSGGGGGGGGGSMARPVAVITISSQGVEIQPVVDVTKLGLALFVTAGSMFMMLSRMRRLSRG